MNLIEQKLNGLKVFENRRFSDHRGFFEEFYQQEKSGLSNRFIQVNHSRSLPGVLRGLHFQLEPAQSKLVGIIKGRIWDVAVDIREGSPTRGQHFGTELSEANGRLLWIPAGFAHGFCVLGDEPADILYLVDAVYNPKTEKGLRWNDPTFNIPWPLDRDPIISERDQQLPVWQP